MKVASEVCVLLVLRCVCCVYDCPLRATAAPTAMCVASQVENLLTGSHSCSWPDSSLACAITSTGDAQTRHCLWGFTLPGTHSCFHHVCPPPRVVYVFGTHVKEPPTDVTPTFLTTGVLSTLRQADFEAHSILRESGKCVCASPRVSGMFWNQRGFHSLCADWLFG